MLLLGLGSLSGCAPKASSVPLGRGPLAQAEDISEQTEKAAHRPKPSARSAVPAEAPAPTAEAATSGEGAKSETSGAHAHGRAEADSDSDRKPKSNGEAPRFEGLYAGKDVAIYRMSGDPDREEKDDKAKIRIAKPAAGSVRIILVNSADGSDLCELVARVEGNAAILESAQPCFTPEGEEELTSGRAVVVGDRLEMDAEWTLSVKLPDQELDGELSYSFKGERQ